jgi:SAM-dependent methyltransferase
MATDDGSVDSVDGQSQAHRYAQHVAPTFVKVARRAVDLAEIEPGDSVLDLGTGTGLVAFLAAERAGRDGTVIGLDESAPMLAVARERSAAVGYEHIKWQQGEVAQLTFADESFDAALAVQSLTLLARPDAALEELRRVLVEGGRAVITVWGTRTANEWMEVLEGALQRALPRVRPPEPYGLRQPGNLEALMQAAGFVDIEVARVPDVMRFQGADGFWSWVCAVPRWGGLIAGLPADGRARFRSAVVDALGPRTRQGETIVGRELVFARGVSPAADDSDD